MKDKKRPAGTIPENNTGYVEKCKSALFKVSDYFDDSPALMSVRQGMIMLIPLLVLGAMALMLSSLPIPAYQKLLPRLLNGKVVEFLAFVRSASLNLFALALALTTSFSYAMLRKKEKGVGYGDSIILMLITLISLIGYSGIQYEDFSITSLGTSRIFTALFISLLSGKMFFMIRDKGLFRLKQKGMEAEGLYVEAVSGIIPALLIVAFWAILQQMFILLFHVQSFQELLEKGIDALFNVVDNDLVSAILILFLEHSTWFVGIHGSNIVEPIMQENFAVGSSIYNKTFHDIFILLGGSGAVLCLVIAILLFSRKSSIRNVSKLSLPTVIFNISEIAAFGIPIILNPIFLIPYILIPIVLCIIAYAAIYLGLVPPVTQTVGWTTPILLSGYQATGSIAGSILQTVCLVTGIAIYLPFLRLFEERDARLLVKNVNHLTKELQRQEKAKSISPLTERNDLLGDVARSLTADLKDAVKNKKLFFVYQPQVDTKGKCIGAETLIRWNHPIAGFIYPPLIIELAKEGNMLHDIESYLFDESTHAVKEIGKSIHTEFKISLNITNESLAWDGFEKCLREKVEKYDIQPRRLWLEITEQDALVTSDEMMDKIQRIKEHGHKFLIDDFGMGHTSLMYLQTNHFDLVKLDGSLTRDVMENTRNEDIIAAITELGKTLHFETIAEYVETDLQRDKLQKLGCNGFQGYLYSKPIPLTELIAWMKEH
ncbi:MAG: EAL domain-containing protein [Roseburia sp.]|nr:EAL domain-containing protein [Roseburia sp.]MCM1241560.1 EAL domain-containing protein [Roseburia sp.]